MLKTSRFFVLLMLVFLGGQSQAHSVKEPRTVLDFFYLLPDKFFEYENPGSAGNRRKWLYSGFDAGIPADNRPIIDLKNDFLRFPGDGAQGRLDIAVFRYHGQATVGVYDAFEEGDLFFWRYQNDKLREVTRSVLPRNWSDKHSYLLPRVGTTIRVFAPTFYASGITSRTKPTHNLVWQKGRFQLRP